jgi:hypothetical protein
VIEEEFIYNKFMPFTYKSLPWLLENDASGVRYLALKNLAELPKDNPELIQAKKKAYTDGQIGRILKHIQPEGYWNKPGGGYGPKYYSTVWSLILLSQLGASVNDDKRIAKSCKYYLDHAYSTDHSISYNGNPSGTIDCLQGNMCCALVDLGYQDERLGLTFDWMARSVLGTGVKFYASKCGPKFACGANGKKPCAWGAVKILLALGKTPNKVRNQIINQAIQKGVDFLFSIDPYTAKYPTTNNEKPNGSWWKLGFPTFYCTDLLQLAEALTRVGHGHDPRLKSVLDYIMSKQDDQGRWKLEHEYTGKTWGNFGKKGESSKWVTFRVLKLLKMLNK